MEDRPKSLKDRAERETRRQMLHQAHITPLTDLVEEIKREQPVKDVPYFDPMDGGVEAQCLYVLESPGRMTKSKSGSGFISRNNNDDTAKNFFEINEEVGIPRSKTVSWNIVPWDISEDGKKQAPDSSEIERGLVYLHRLIDRLPNLQVIVFVGNKAKKALEDVKAKRGDIVIYHCPHPSPSNLNTRSAMRTRIVEALKQVKALLDSPCFRFARPTASEFAAYYAGYIAGVPDGDIVQTLAKQRIDALKLFAALTPEQAAFRYAPGKWSVREVIGHVVDAERIFAYRALRVGRNDKTPLSGFEENDYVTFGNFESRSVAELAGDFDHVRTSTIDLLSSFDEDVWVRTGVANAFNVSVRALAWIIAGHEGHHVDILRSRYLGR